MSPTDHEYLALCGVLAPCSLGPGWSWRLQLRTKHRDRAWLLIAPDGEEAGEVPLACTSSIAAEFRWVAFDSARADGHEDSVIGAAAQLVEWAGAGVEGATHGE